MAAIQKQAMSQRVVRSGALAPVVPAVGISRSCITSPLRPSVSVYRHIKPVRATESEQEDRPKLTRDAEPEQYWVSKSEQKGANPFKDPLAIIGLVAIFFPFLLLLVAIATGIVDVSVYR